MLPPEDALKEEAHSVADSKLPQMSQARRVPPQPIAELVVIPDWRWQHHQEVDVEKNVAKHIVKIVRMATSAPVQSR